MTRTTLVARCLDFVTLLSRPSRRVAALDPGPLVNLIFDLGVFDLGVFAPTAPFRPHITPPTSPSHPPLHFVRHGCQNGSSTSRSSRSYIRSFSPSVVRCLLRVRASRVFLNS
jgi:hypothetical protein